MKLLLQVLAGEIAPPLVATSDMVVLYKNINKFV